MMEEKGIKHLKDHLFHGLKPNIHNALCYMYDKPDSQYSQLVMAARKAETEIPGSNVLKARAKSAVVETNSQSKVAMSDPSYEAINQQIAYIMSAITNQSTNKTNGQNGPKQNNGDRKFSDVKTQKFKKDRKDMKCWGCRSMGHGWRECSTPRQGNNLPFKPTSQNQNTNPNLNGQQGKKCNPPILSQPQPGRNQHQWTTKTSQGIYGTRIL